MGLGIMLRIHFLQQWFNLSDPAAGGGAVRFAGAAAVCGAWILGTGSGHPDETTILQFRHLLEKRDLGGAMLDTVNRYLEGPRHPHRDRHHCGPRPLFMLRPSTKNAQGERDPEMHQTRKGNQWYFG